MDIFNINARVLTSDANDPEVKLQDQGLQVIHGSRGEQGNVCLHLDSILIAGQAINASIVINMVELAAALAGINNAAIKALLENNT